MSLNADTVEKFPWLRCYPGLKASKNHLQTGPFRGTARSFTSSVIPAKLQFRGAERPLLPSPPTKVGAQTLNKRAFGKPGSRRTPRRN
jgi:hypothetical protein